MKIVITDAFLVDAGGVSWAPLETLGEVVRYDDSLPEELPERIRDAEAVFTNRCRFPEELIRRAPKLKMIGTFGTGVDKIDCEAARRLGVTVCNIPGYGSGAVAQMAAALLFAIGRQTAFFDHRRSPMCGRWSSPARPSAFTGWGISAMPLRRSAWP